MMRIVILTLTLMAGLAAMRLAAAETGMTAKVYDGKVLCIQAAHLTENSFEQVKVVQATNKAVGTILDLRFADGDAKGVDAMAKALTAKKGPLAILVNSETRGAAADLAGRLRSANAGLVIGSTNAPGQVVPDIALNVSLEDEKKYVADPYVALMTNSLASFMAKNDLLPIVDHTSEAELVQKHIKDGEDMGDETLTPRVAPSQPVIRDPELARAVDLLKALALLNHSRG